MTPSLNSENRVSSVKRGATFTSDGLVSLKDQQNIFQQQAGHWWVWDHNQASWGWGWTLKDIDSHARYFLAFFFIFLGFATEGESKVPWGREADVWRAKEGVLLERRIIKLLTTLFIYLKYLHVSHPTPVTHLFESFIIIHSVYRRWRLEQI